jgi:hypothetical protein
LGTPRHGISNLGPTSATVLRAGTLRLNPFKISAEGRLGYAKTTSWKAISPR